MAKYFSRHNGTVECADSSGETYADNMAEVSGSIDLWLACGRCLSEPQNWQPVSLLNPTQVSIHWDGAMRIQDHHPYVSDPTWEAVFSDFAIPAEPFSGYNQPVVLQITESFRVAPQVVPQPVGRRLGVERLKCRLHALQSPLIY